MTAVDTGFPADEAARVAAVRRFAILDTPPDSGLDRITAMAARLLGTPVALISIVDADRIWFKSRHGLRDVEQIDRHPGLCASAILSDAPWVIPDAAVDPRTRSHPLVSGSFGLRFYAGVPLRTVDGHGIGTLSVLDREPRELDAVDLETLTALAGLVMDQLELRLQARSLVAAESELRHDAERLADALQASLLPPRPPSVPGMEVATRFIAGERGLRVGGDFYDVFRRDSNDWAIVLGDVCGKGAAAAALAASARWTIRASAGHHREPRAVLRELNAALQADAELHEDTRYLSAAFARLELDTCGAWLTLASSGHPLPVLVRASGRVEQRGEPSLPLGLFDEVDPAEDRVGLGPGDSLVFYTDGVTEARNRQGELYGEERLLELLSGCPGCTGEQIAQRIVTAVAEFSGNSRADDLALLVASVPEDARADPIGRVSSALGVPTQQLQLPSYPHGDTSPASG